MDTYKLELFHEALLKLLQRLEWSGVGYSGLTGGCCPVCKGIEPLPILPGVDKNRPSNDGGHMSECELAETIEALGVLVHQ
jgi:hypothetical protein